MLDNSIAATAKLDNGKMILIDGHVVNGYVGYRYLLESEAETGQISRLHIPSWMHAPVYRTIDENGSTIIYTEIEGSCVLMYKS